MRTIERSSAFKKDWKRVLANPRHKQIESQLVPVLERLVQDLHLEDSLRDHGLVGNWNGYRECHIKPDLLLIYSVQIDGVLRLARIGSHSELF
ncbi:MAG: type II toxin-antitoxin system YafQ family toxin [Gammaproteobacteria bacterium SHHR-1]|uniref:type II toxin-antitoxin system RelE/ParE family toxin n=1 Tax=Magnetovirga frankeli TaxID=947516 RepID=UPI001293948E|nr:type II toxin-antitoxin system YafQ family toxin [gamma proteobacterium SS-5]